MRQQRNTGPHDCSPLDRPVTASSGHSADGVSYPSTSSILRDDLKNCCDPAKPALVFIMSKFNVCNLFMRQACCNGEVLNIIAAFSRACFTMVERDELNAGELRG